MILTDYLLCENGPAWDYALQCGATSAVIRLPEEPSFDPTNGEHWDTVCNRFIKRGITPLVLEPLPNTLHDHIKSGDEKRYECIEKAIKMFPHMARNGVNTLCFNFMAHIGWTRTGSQIKERGGALVTEFNIADYQPQEHLAISHKELWHNYTQFISAAAPEAERWGIKLALHPDDPPLSHLGNVSRIFTSYNSIKRALEIANSDNVGVTFCQATYAMMGEDLYNIIPKLANKIFFIHFRNVRGNKQCFQETFHDNGELNMPELIELYKKHGINVPIRIDHVPTFIGEANDTPGYASLGRLFALGYLKGLLRF